MRTPTRAPTMLVVDDDPVIPILLSRALRQTGYTVLCAANGLEALECLKTHRVDLILSDIVMPQMDGLALCLRVRAEPAWAHIPVVMMSGLDTPAFPPNLAAHILAKPITLAMLDALIPDLLAQRATRERPRTEPLG